MPCFGSKRVEIVPITEEVTGRLESDGNSSSKQPPRDGLHSAPNSREVAHSAPSPRGARKGLHSAPQRGTPEGKAALGAKDDTLKPLSPIGDFIIEGAGESSPSPSAVDAYLDDLLGPRIVKDLRGIEWAQRVSGLEAVQKLVKRKAAGTDEFLATGQQADGASIEAERASLFRGCITVLARALQDKVVPVFLPALSLLADVFSAEFLQPIASSPLPHAAIAHFAHQLVFRAGSSNVRAREESSTALLALARCESVGCVTIAPWVLRPLSNSKSSNAVVGRLELIRRLVAEFGLGRSSGLEVQEVLTFTLPLCEVASSNARESALGLVLDMRSTDARRVDALVEDMRPGVSTIVKARLAPSGSQRSLNGLSVSGRRLPPIGSSMAAADQGDEVAAFQTTPPGHEARARARQTASELGVRGPPAARTKSRKATSSSAVHDEGGLLAEADALIAESSPTGALRFDRTEEELMADILQEVN